MMDSWCGMPLVRYRAYEAEGRFASNYLDSEQDVVKCQPAGDSIGPTRELARFYEMMLNRGVSNGKRLLSTQTVEAMTTPRRAAASRCRPGTDRIPRLAPSDTPAPAACRPSPIRSTASLPRSSAVSRSPIRSTTTSDWDGKDHERDTSPVTCDAGPCGS